MRFSERYGYKPVRTAMQRENVEDGLRNRLWNLFHFYFLAIPRGTSEYEIFDHKKRVIGTFNVVLDEFLSLRATSQVDYETVISNYHHYFFRFQWYELFDFLEYMAENNASFMRETNELLKEELSAYRFVSGKIVEMTSEEEVAAIEQALEVPDSLKPVRDHLHQALSHLSNKAKPDYRNSVKESISAVESACKLIAKDDKASLDSALKAIAKQVEIHGALKKGFGQLYGYTSDAEGIRHALMEEQTLDAEDAKFMLVTCSAFINYLIVKSQKAGIKF
jgi:hypothetical protein